MTIHPLCYPGPSLPPPMSLPSARSTMLDPRVYWVLLSAVSQVGPARFRRLLEAFGDAEAAWRAGPAALAGAGLDRRAIEALGALRAKADPAEVWRQVERTGAKVLTWDDAAYPEPLGHIPDPPPVLYIRGELLSADRFAVAVVGTRRGTAYGRQVAERLVAELARAGVTVVSGLARGTDAIAHRAALEQGGRTLAVLGSGLDRIYPAEHAALAREIAAQGALISEFPLGPTHPRSLRLPS